MTGKDKFIHAWEYISTIVLYFMMLGLASQLKISAFKECLKNPRGIFTTMFLQFFIMPLFCWLLSLMFSLDQNMTIALITVGCCPGGALSNVLCYVFQADITLSIAMTTCSSIVSIGMLPLNTFIYIKLAGKVTLNYDWAGMIITTLVVIGGTLSGLFVSVKFPKYTHRLDQMGRIAMWIIIIGTITVNNISGGGLFRTRYRGAVYASAVLPSIFGGTYALIVTTLLDLPKPSRLAVVVECAMQNQILALGILTLTIRSSEARIEAYAIPILYATFSFVLSICVMIFFFYRGWTYSQAKTLLEAIREGRRKRQGGDIEMVKKPESPRLAGETVESHAITGSHLPTDSDIIISSDVELQKETWKTNDVIPVADSPKQEESQPSNQQQQEEESKEL